MYLFNTKYKGGKEADDGRSLPQFPPDCNSLKKSSEKKEKENPFSDDESVNSNEATIATIASTSERIHDFDFGPAKEIKPTEEEEEDSPQEFGLEEIDMILDPLQYEPKAAPRYKKYIKDLPPPDRRQGENSNEDANKPSTTNKSKKLLFPKHLRKSDWLEIDKLRDEIDEDIALLNFLKTTQDKVKDITKKANKELGYRLIGSSTSSSNSSSPELGDSQAIVPTKSKPFDFHSPKHSLDICYTNSEDDIINSFSIEEKSGWLDELTFDQPDEPGEDPLDALDEIFTRVEQLKVSPINQSSSEDLEIERSSSPCKGNRQSLGWCAPNKSLELPLPKESELGTISGQLEGPKSSDDDFWVG